MWPMSCTFQSLLTLTNKSAPLNRSPMSFINGKYSFGGARTIRYIRLLLIDPGPDAIACIPEFEVWGESDQAAP